MKKTLEAAFTHLGFRCSVFLADIRDELNEGAAFSTATVWRCGYVEVPEGHPYYGCAFDESPAGRRDLPPPVHGMDAPGGIQYSARSKGGWTLGFSCGESGDATNTWNMSRVGVECRKLASRLHSLCKVPPAGKEPAAPAPVEPSVWPSCSTGKRVKRRRKTVEKNITRYDYDRCTFSGYRVTKRSGGARVTVYITDRRCGGQAAALKVAREVRSEIYEAAARYKTQAARGTAFERIRNKYRNNS